VTDKPINIPPGIVTLDEAAALVEQNIKRLPDTIELFVAYAQFFLSEREDEGVAVNEALFARVTLALLQADFEIEMQKQNELGRIRILATRKWKPKWKLNQ
jgi:hypothetical protein